VGKTKEQASDKTDLAAIRQNWKQLVKPYRVRVDQSVADGRSAELVFEPLECGYGQTLGTALRRVVLSSLRGTAVTAVDFNNALHEFSSLPGVIEDVTHIVLNLKRLDVKLSGKDTETVRLRATGPCVVTASQIDAGAHASFLSPDQVICTLSEGASLDCELTLSRGKGYVPASRRAQEESPLGTILIDATYSPVRSFSFAVDSTRVGQFTNYDRLTVKIETDGTLSPQEALCSAACILQDQLSKFVVFPDAADMLESDASTASSEARSNFSPDLLRRVEELDLSLRAFNCLKKEGVTYVGDLVQRSQEDLLRAPNFGSKSLSEIVGALEQMGLSLGMPLKGWPPADLQDVEQKKDDKGDVLADIDTTGILK
jgi:DNA-directed RNA polymerase subunit alpha